MAFQDDGAWSKWLHPGWAAHGGIVAAGLAATGFAGPLTALSGRYDLYAALLAGEEVDRGGLTADLGERWAGAEARFKYYPCAHVIQPYVDAALAILADHAVDVTDIAEIRCAVAPWIVPIVCEPRAARVQPATEMDAIASLYFQLAYALSEKRLDLAVLDAATRARPTLHSLAERVSYHVDASLTEDFRAVVEIVLRDGRRHSARATAPGFDAARLERKFLNNAAPTVGRERAGALIEALAEPGPPDWRAAAALLRLASLAAPGAGSLPTTSNRVEARQ
jgi:2-methylcitrate dehydratase PrpD